MRIGCLKQMHSHTNRMNEMSKLLFRADQSYAKVHSHTVCAIVCIGPIAWNAAEKQSTSPFHCAN